MRVVAVHDAPVAVGVLREPFLIVIVKVSLTAEAGALEASTPQAPARLVLSTHRPTLHIGAHSEPRGEAAREERLESDRGGGSPFAAGTDFVSGKAAVDLLIAGYARSVEPSADILAGVTIAPEGRATDPSLPLHTSPSSATFVRRFRARSGASDTAIPLVTPYVFEEDGVTPTTVGAEPLSAAEALESARTQPDASFTIASKRQRVAAIAPGSVLLLEGMLAHGPAWLALPDLTPWTFVEVGDEALGQPLPLLDTIAVDASSGAEPPLGEAADVRGSANVKIDLTWRGVLRIGPTAAEDLERVIVALRPSGEEPDYTVVARELPRWQFSMLAEADEPSNDPVDEDEATILEMARMESLGHGDPPDPSVSLQEYARISATLADEPDHREAILAANGMTAHTWLVEERAWLEALARTTLDGDGTLAARFGEEFVLAQDRLGEVPEMDWEDYVETSVAVENATRPDDELRKRSISIGQWMRIDRHHTSRAASDPELADRMQAYRVRLEERLAEVGEDEDAELAAEIAAEELA